MQKVYLANGDIHTATATALAAMHGNPWASLSKAQQKQYRTRAKAVNFGFIYGMHERGFQQYAAASYDLYLTLADSRAFRDMFFDLYPELPHWHTRAKDEALKTGVARLLTGRVRHLPNVYSHNNYLRSKALRQAINTPVQGLASEIMLAGMLQVDKHLPHYARIVGQCHDAVFVECVDSPDEIDEVCRLIDRDLTGVMGVNPLLQNIPWPIPLSVEIKVGNAWGDPNAKVFSKNT
jgi:DNA polymerase-1